MSAIQQPGEASIPVLMLFVTGNAPRSERARANIARMLERLDRTDLQPYEVDLLKQPEKGIQHSVFATPSLVRVSPNGEVSVLYGDLSDEDRLSQFLYQLSPNR